jgi:hypothetical protein
MKRITVSNAGRMRRNPIAALRAIGASAALLAVATACAPPAGNQDFISGSHGILPFSIVENSPVTEKVETTEWLDQLTGGTKLVAEGQRYAPIGEQAHADVLTMTPATHFNNTVSFGPGQAPFRITLYHANALLGTVSQCTVGAAGNGPAPAATYENPSASGSVTTAITAQGAGSGLWRSVSATGTITVKNCTTLTAPIGQKEYTTSVEDWQVSFRGTAI